MDAKLMAEIFRLKRLGWPDEDLAIKFSLDKEFVRRLCYRHRVKADEYKSPRGNILPREKNYKDYLRQAGIVHRSYGDVLDL